MARLPLALFGPASGQQVTGLSYPVDFEDVEPSA